MTVSSRALRLVLVIAAAFVPAGFASEAEAPRPDYPYAPYCAMIQAGLKPTATVFGFKAQDGGWSVRFCPACTADLRSQLKFVPSAEGRAAGYAVPEKGFVGVENWSAPIYAGFREYLERFNCSLRGAEDKTGYKQEFAGAARECVRKASVAYLLRKFGLGQSSLQRLTELHRQPAERFYKECRALMERAAKRDKLWGDRSAGQGWVGDWSEKDFETVMGDPDPEITPTPSQRDERKPKELPPEAETPGESKSTGKAGAGK